MKYLFYTIIGQIAFSACYTKAKITLNSEVISNDKVDDIQGVVDESSNDNVEKLKNSILDRIDKLNKLDELNGWTVELYR